MAVIFFDYSGNNLVFSFGERLCQTHFYLQTNVKQLRTKAVRLRKELN
jgi:hypothetical protein